MKGFILVMSFLPSFFFPLLALSIEVAPRITDREIIERLTRLDEGQKGFVERIEETNRRIDEGRKILAERIEELRQLVLWGFGVTFAGMFALVGFVIWDRRSALSPAIRQIDELKERERRLEEALRGYAAKSSDMADELRKIGLL